LEQVILVDDFDNEIGTMEKIEAHRKSVLHRAVSVFIVNNQGKWLLQRRAFDKYHSGGLWTNSCCTHPRPGETSVQAANRRLNEEMGISAELKEIFRFKYKNDLDNELTEHELDHVFIGFTNEKPNINTDEVAEWRYVSYKKLITEIMKHPSNYTVWFRRIVERVNKHIHKSHSFDKNDF
jgi:isopentenyl-diphosphate delta-isomerase